MNIKQKRLLNIIAVEAVMLDWVEAFEGVSYGNQHLFRVNEIVKFLLDREGGDSFVALVAAWCHDVSLVVGRDDEPERVERYTEEFLGKFEELSENDKGKILKAVISHELGGDDLSMEGKLVHDADVVDKSGMLGVIRHIWKMSNMLKDRQLKGAEDLKELRNHLKSREKQVHFASTKNLIDDLNEVWDLFFADEVLAVEIMEKISKMAREGEISDRIGEWIANEYSGSEVGKQVSGQLQCSYFV